METIFSLKAMLQTINILIELFEFNVILNELSGLIYAVMYNDLFIIHQ